MRTWVPRPLPVPGLIAAGLLLSGCDPGDVVLVQPDRPARTGAAVDVRVVRDGQPVEGARVTYVRMDVHDLEWGEATTDSSGLVGLTSLTGFFWVFAEWEGPDGRIWGGGEKVLASERDGGELEVPLSPPRTGDVVISEIYMNAPPVWETGSNHYPHGKYVELANNSDRTVYLDGMVLAKAYELWGMAQTWISWGYSCADNEHLRNDPEGVWSPLHWRIPGSGADHPLGPGEVALIAVVAADHREIHPSMLDLSHADFEFGLPGLADNPGAPNLEYLGPQLFTTSDLYVNFWIIAEPTDVSEMPTYDDWTAIRGPAPLPQRRIPAERIQDVTYIWWDRTDSYTPSPPRTHCNDPVHPSFDRIPGGFVGSDDDLISSQRRSVTVDGRKILLDTNVSAVDFIRAERTPGWLP